MTRRMRRARRDRLGCGRTIGGFLLVTLRGGALSFFATALGFSISVGVPFTESNMTMAGAIGAKDRVIGALPTYTRERVAGNQNFINKTTSLTIGPAEGLALFIVGRQEGAPAIDLYISLR